jgi:hypothetical protein
MYLYTEAFPRDHPVSSSDPLYAVVLAVYSYRREIVPLLRIDTVILNNLYIYCLNLFRL